MVNNFVPNGLICSKEIFVPKVLERSRWSQVEDRTIELLQFIRPNPESETLRNNIVSYIKDVITTHVPVEVFEFGSVPLKTYLPDGDIDLTIFGNNELFPEIFINQIQQILESEKNNEFSKFRIKEVQLVEAEVKIIKCLVEKFVIDISFNQLSGLCSLCFFEEVDHLISENHTFKLSIILVKAWCYHESRLLGSNSGLFSTYALEVLVLYIFNLYNNEFAGPLEVLFRFLEFFSKFDWGNYCISLSGPVPLGSLPNMTAECPRKDRQDLLLTEIFLNACKFCYGPRNQENHENPFVSKHINIIDPLRANNNLGRSINKGNFFRIKSAIAYGAKQMVRMLDCTDEYLISEFDHFFKNTWDRHGNGSWIGAHIYNRYIRKKEVGKPTCQEFEDEQDLDFLKSQGIYQKSDNQLKESNQMFGTYDACVVSQTQSSRTNGMLSCDRNHTSSTKNAHTDKGKTPLCSSHWKSDEHIGLQKEERNFSKISESNGTPMSVYLHALMHESKNNETMRQQEEEHHIVSTRESGKSLKFNGDFRAVLGAKESDASFPPPPPQNMAFTFDASQFPELQRFPSAKKSLNVKKKHNVDPPDVLITDSSVMKPAESCKEKPTSETNLSSSPLKPTQPEALNVHVNRSPCASGSSVTQFPFRYNNISHFEASHYLLNQCYDVLNGDFGRYWNNLQYGRYCENGQLEELLYYPPFVVHPMDSLAQFYWNMRTLGSENVVPPPVVLGMPPTFAYYSHDDIIQHVPFSLPRFSGGIGTFMPNPLAYHERYFDTELYRKHLNTNNIPKRQMNSNFNSRGRCSSSRERSYNRAQNHYRRNKKREGKEKASHQVEEGSSSSVNEQ